MVPWQSVLRIQSICISPPQKQQLPATAQIPTGWRIVYGLLAPVLKICGIVQFTLMQHISSFLGESFFEAFVPKGKKVSEACLRAMHAAYVSHQLLQYATRLRRTSISANHDVGSHLHLPLLLLLVLSPRRIVSFVSSCLARIGCCCCFILPEYSLSCTQLSGK